MASEFQQARDRAQAHAEADQGGHQGVGQRAPEIGHPSQSAPVHDHPPRATPQAVPALPFHILPRSRLLPCHPQLPQVRII